MHVAALDTLSKFDDEARLYAGKSAVVECPIGLTCRGRAARDGGLNGEDSRRGGGTPGKFLTAYDPIHFFVTITEGIVTLDIDKAAAQMALDYLNDAAIFAYLERKRERGMTKWIDQSALDAAINRRRYFPLFRVAARSDTDAHHRPR